MDCCAGSDLLFEKATVEKSLRELERQEVPVWEIMDENCANEIEIKREKEKL